eukprot:NODE_987_length_1278_cov_517.996729.p1 GENE.NODE_987_length_1278_cov_517.996729~~NODE_987_length_1278_cov_517.996729.p1  ORF type:complete len:374 (-),score=87.15 NODE_987_length_1278_cov_517.996729:139-1260(-)
MGVPSLVNRDFKDGRGIALTYNNDRPRAIKTMISHAWSEPVAAFLRDVRIVTVSDPDSGIFTCFLALFQGTWADIDAQVSQGGADMQTGCFAEVLHSVHQLGGNMWVISNDNEREKGLYARLWCTWEVYCAVRDGVLIKMHPLKSTAAHLFGRTGKAAFDPASGTCGSTGDMQKIRDAVVQGVGWTPVAQAVMRSSSFTAVGGRLDADGYNLGPEGVAELCTALKGNTTFNGWDLSKNDMRDEGAEALAGALKANTTLTELRIYQNAITDVGAQALADALEANTTLKTLDLAGNAITDAGAQALAGALEANSTLKLLLLNGNAITDAGAQALAGALEANSTLTRLYLEDDKITDAGTKALKDARKGMSPFLFP